MRRKFHFVCRLPALVSLFLVITFARPFLLAAAFTLSTQVEGEGTLSRNPTNSALPEGVVVTVTATPAQAWYFERWTGDATGAENPLNVQMTDNKMITAVFRPVPTYTVTTSAEGMGTITLDPAGGPYLSNSVVTATATAMAGWVFVNWSGDVTGSANPLPLAMDTNKELTAVFAQLPVIDQPPQDQSAEPGATVNFHVHAVGTEPLSYQWWFNDSKLDGEMNPTLNLQNIQLAHEGTYSVVVSNPFGSATNSATLTIQDGCSGTNVVTVAEEAALRQGIEIGGLVRLCFNGTVTLSNTIGITRDVTLDARNRLVSISGDNAVRLFHVSPGVTFAATNVMFVNGRHVGQDGANAGTEPAQDGFPGEGAAILNEGGTIQLISCTLSNNSVVGGMGGAPGQPFFEYGVGGDGRGAAISTHGGSVFLNSSILANNCATGGPGATAYLPPVGPTGNARGGALYCSNALVTCVDVRFYSNICMAPAGYANAHAYGGALFEDSGAVVISNSSLLGNLALGGNSPIVLVGVVYPGFAYGGAVAAMAGKLEIRHSVIESNAAVGGQAFRHSGTGEAGGGAIFSSAELLARDTFFAHNQALSGNYSSANTDGRGGALHNSGSAVIERCAFISNNAVGGASASFGSPGADFPPGHGLGGGIFNVSDLTMTNCTLALNTARGGNGSTTLNGSGFGGGIYNSNGAVIGVNLTIASNSAVGGQTYLTNGPAAGANVANASSSLSLLNSIVAYPNTSSNAWGPITDAGFNISSDGSANFSSGSSFNFTDPRLLPLANNGGLTLTMALQDNSPAVDLGTAIGAPHEDQRGLERPWGLGVDVGAYEWRVEGARLSLTQGAGAVRLALQIPADTRWAMQESPNFSDWIDAEILGPYNERTTIERIINPSALCRYYRLEQY